jgi:hypothetical protein
VIEFAAGFAAAIAAAVALWRGLRLRVVRCRRVEDHVVVDLSPGDWLIVRSPKTREIEVLPRSR